MDEKHVKSKEQDHNRIIDTIIRNSSPMEDVYIGDSYMGGHFIAVDRSGSYTVIGSTYSPQYEAERYELQYIQNINPYTVVLFGFGTGDIIIRLLENDNKYENIVVFEPSVDIFKKAMEIRDLSVILRNPRLHIFLGETLLTEFEQYLLETADFLKVKSYRYSCLSQYKDLFPALEQAVKEKYDLIIKHMQADYDTAVYFRKEGVRCEIMTFKYLMHAKNLYELKPYIDPEVPCIVVASGPSLEKNVKHLLKAKDKALIFCADSAADYLVSQGIIPDMICTVDSNKQGDCFTNESLHKIPLAITTTSSSDQIDKIDNPEVMYFGSMSILHGQVFEMLGYDMPFVFGGGSVACTIFELAVELGFRTIILCGQDLALTNNMAHAGKGELVDVDVSPYNLQYTEGYYGDQVLTRSDFMLYLEWYRSKISTLNDMTIINATEGGAKIDGTIQMPLKDAIDEYCNKDYCFEKIYHQLTYMIRSEDQRMAVYKKLIDHKQLLQEMYDNVILTCRDTEKALHNLKKRMIHPEELERVNKNNNRILDQVASSDATDMIFRYMIQTESDIAEGIGNHDSDPIKEIMDLYQRMIRYQSELLDAINYQLDIWGVVLKNIGNRYTELELVSSEEV